MECAHLDQSLQTALGTQEMHNYNLEHLFVSECGWTGSRRKVTQDGSTILFSVKDNAYSSGVTPYCKQTSSQISDDAEGNHLRYTKKSRVYLKLLQFHHLAVLCLYQQRQRNRTKMTSMSNRKVPSPKSHIMKCYSSLGIWMLKMEVITLQLTLGERTQWDVTVVEPSTTKEIKFALITDA